jgi:hypothetical protein
MQRIKVGFSERKREKMKRFMRVFCINFLLIFCFAFTAVASYTLQDVLAAHKGIAEHQPSLFIAPVTGELIKIKEDTYQVRLFSYEIDEGISTPLTKEFKNKTFEALVKENDLLLSSPKPGPEAINPVDYFSASPEMKKRGVNFLLSLRKIPKHL